jgi:protein-S-isoprenylcysteine O-methyltransferase Ste14
MGPVLSVPVVQILAGTAFVGTLVALVLGGSSTRSPSPPARVVAKRKPGRWAEVSWAGGTFVSVFWSIAVLIAPEFAYHWPAIMDFAESVVLQVLGFLVAIAGGVLFFTARRALGRHMTPAIQVREDQPLVQEGPYRYVRHPLYTAIVTSTGGLSLLYLSPVLALVAVVLAGVATYRAQLEEELLGLPEAFGTAYAAYVARTGRFLPRLRIFPKESGNPRTP